MKQGSLLGAGGGHEHIILLEEPFHEFKKFTVFGKQSGLSKMKLFFYIGEIIIWGQNSASTIVVKNNVLKCGQTNSHKGQCHQLMGTTDI